jgi:hypothetical protein
LNPLKFTSLILIAFERKKCLSAFQVFETSGAAMNFLALELVESEFSFQLDDDTLEETRLKASLCWETRVQHIQYNNSTK